MITVAFEVEGEVVIEFEYSEELLLRDLYETATDVVLGADKEIDISQVHVVFRKVEKAATQEVRTVAGI